MSIVSETPFVAQRSTGETLVIRASRPPSNATGGGIRDIQDIQDIQDTPSPVADVVPTPEAPKRVHWTFHVPVFAREDDVHVQRNLMAEFEAAATPEPMLPRSTPPISDPVSTQRHQMPQMPQRASWWWWSWR